MRLNKNMLTGLLLMIPVTIFAQSNYPVDSKVVAQIREEGFQRSEIPSTLSYMTDVIGARLTNSDAMYDAQDWVVSEMKKMGLKNIKKEPFMDYGVSWDNEYFSLHLLQPDYQPMLGYPIAHTPGTNGRQDLSVVIATIKTKDDLKKYRGKLRGKAVLSSPMPSVDQERYRTGRPRYTDEQLKEIANNPFPDPPRPPRPPANPDLVSAVDKNTFYKKEGVSVILESRSGWIAAVRGFERPGAKKDV
jgi:carboxypeptidase Q